MAARITFNIDGRPVPAPEGWQGLEVYSQFENDSVQPSVSIESVTLVRDARDAVLDWIERGKAGDFGFFEGIPFSIEAQDGAVRKEVFRGLLNLAREFSDDKPRGRVTCGLSLEDDLFELDERMQGITFEQLLQDGLLGGAITDVEYIVEPPVDVVAAVLQAVLIFTLLDKIADLAKDTGRTAATAVGLALTGLTGPAASGTYLGGASVVQAAYLIALIAALIIALTSFVNAYVPKRRTHKALRVRGAMSAIAQALGYELDTNLPLLDELTYLPSNLNVDQSNAAGFIGRVGTIRKGIPAPGDFGFTAAEFMTLVMRVFNARMAVVDGVLQVRNRDDEFWRKQSDYVLPNVLDNPTRYNSNEAFASRLMTFAVDQSDIYTVEEYAGTAFQVLTQPIKRQRPATNFLSQFERIDLPVALGVRKDTQGPILSLLAGTLRTIDTLVRTIGGSTSFASLATQRLGVLKVSTNNHAVPKLLLVRGGKLPANHRQTLSAKALYQRFYNDESFAAGERKGQKRVFDRVLVPFGFAEFEKLRRNSYIYTADGEEAKITEVSWQVGEDKALISGWWREVYTTNVQETTIEPGNN